MSRPAAICRTTLPQAMVRMPGCQRNASYVHRPAEAEHVAHDDRLVVGRVVADLHDPDLVDPLAEAGHHQRQDVVGEARVDAVDVHRGVALVAGVLDPREELGRQDLLRPLQQHRPAAGDVDARLDERDEVLDALEDPVVGHRGVHDRVRRQGDQRVPVVGGLDARARGRGRPGSPASLPSFSGLDTHTPTSSMSGWASMPAIACRPMVPVDQTTTRRGLSGTTWDMPRRLEHVLVMRKGRPLGRL